MRGIWRHLCGVACSTHIAPAVAALSRLASSMLSTSPIYMPKQRSPLYLHVHLTEIPIAQLSILSHNLAVLQLLPVSRKPKRKRQAALYRH
jgi:hypothetical protein